jgi:hypothetical protein
MVEGSPDDCCTLQTLTTVKLVLLRLANLLRLFLVLSKIFYLMHVDRNRIGFVFRLHEARGGK